ncbi:dienelactone hydrolase family protein [Eubacteriaceae bacterium ES2]|nr:dienelactone hydrolase family protein [Eubacteriaceae bacterium ES2]
MGFSVGATIAWRCSISDFCDGIIGFYGSRIRNYLEIEPVCPTLLLFADQDSFDVDAITTKLGAFQKVRTLSFSAKHGFMDQYSTHFDEKSAIKAKRLVGEFLNLLSMKGVNSYGNHNLSNWG